MVRNEVRNKVKENVGDKKLRYCQPIFFLYYLIGIGSFDYRGKRSRILNYEIWIVRHDNGTLVCTIIIKNV